MRRTSSSDIDQGVGIFSHEAEERVMFLRAEGGSGAGDDMAATAVAEVLIIGTANMADPSQRTTLSLPAGTVSRREQAAEVVLFDEARADLPKPYVTSNAEAAEARETALHRREWESRERARTILRQWRSRDPGADGNAMLARPHKDVPIAFLSADTLEAALTRQFADSHLIDRMWDAGQLNDWQYATTNKLLQLCDDTGMLSSKVALIGRIGGGGHGEMSDAMAAAWKEWGCCMEKIGHPGSEVLSELCHGTLPARGEAAPVEAMKDGLRYLSRRWNIDRI
jgi:hypothetical protein